MRRVKSLTYTTDSSKVHIEAGKGGITHIAVDEYEGGVKYGYLIRDGGFPQRGVYCGTDYEIKEFDVKRLAEVSITEGIYDLHFKLLNPNTKDTVDVPPFEPFMGYNWAVEVTSNLGEVREVFADLDNLLDYLGRWQWDRMSYGAQLYTMKFVEKVYYGEFKYFSGHRFPQWKRLGEE